MEINDFKSLVQKYGEYKLRSGDEVSFDCPNCGKGTRKFHFGVNLRKKIFHCFKCHYSGSYGKAGEKTQKPKFVQREVTAKLRGFTRISPSDKDLRKYIKHRGVDFKRAKKLLWGKCDDRRILGRLVLPIIEDGEIVYYVARSIRNVGPKEISPHKDQGWLPRTEVIYGLDDIKIGTTKIVVVEGIFDAEHLKSFGYDAVALLGTNLSDVQIGKILTKRPKEIVLLFDGDSAGQLAKRKAASLLSRRFRGKIVQVALREGTDPDELTEEEARSLLDED